MLRTFAGLMTVVSLASPATLLAAPLPLRDTTSEFGVNYSLGFSDGTLYVYTGDSIYIADLSDESDPSFSLHMSGLESAFGGEVRRSEGVMVTAPGGRALISFGFSDRGVLAVDLGAKTTQPIAAYDTANIYSAAGRPDGTFYVQNAVGTTPNQVDRVAPDLTVTPGVADPADLASGGMAFDALGNLYVGTFDYNLSSPIGEAHFYRISAADIAAFEADGTTPTLEFLGSGASNGNSSMVAGDNGLLYFTTTTGIASFDPSTGLIDEVYLSVVDPDIYAYEFEPLNALAYDTVTDRLVFAEHVGGGAYELRFLAVPEPSMAMLLAPAVLVAFRRTRG